MSHDLRTPLNATIGFSEVMENKSFGVLGSERYKHYVQDMPGPGGDLLDGANNVLDTSKIEAGEASRHE